MYISLATAVYSYNRSLPEAQRVSESHCRSMAEQLAESVMAKVEGAELHPTDLVNPADSIALQPKLDEFALMLCSLSEKQGNIDSAKRQKIRSALRAASARVLAMDSSYYKALHEILNHPMSEGEQRDRAWQRHATWIRSLFERNPIFTIDPEQRIPLSNIYQRLRAYWHDEIAVEGDAAEADQHSHRGQQKTLLRSHVSHLHELMHDWLNDATTSPLRIVAGGPGSGKSSFAKAFAVEVSDQTEWRAIFIELQNLEFDKGDIERRIGEHLTSTAVYSAIDPAGTAGFPQNPLTWRADTSDPVLLIFDGLDELSASTETSTELSRTFVLSVSNYLVRANANTGIAPIRAIILGRSTACEAGVRAANLPMNTVINVAALKPLTSNRDVGLDYSHSEIPDEVIDHHAVREIDQRPEYWKRWAAINDLPNDKVPAVVTSDLLGELNVEPLLLHLLIQSGYTADSNDKAADNRNRVYQEIFDRVLARNEEKTRFNGKVLTARDAMVALECMGLAAWRGGGRTGENTAFRELLERYAPRLYRTYNENSDLLSQNYIAVQFHTRQGFGDGYEFLHKSFGEYLTARALMSIAQVSARRMRDEEEPETLKEAARRWCTLIASAEMTDFVMQFVSDEARLLAERVDILPIKEMLTKLFSWVQHHGMPVHEGASGSYREIEKAQRCAETALFTVLSALAYASRNTPYNRDQSNTSDLPPWSVKIDWPKNSVTGRGDNPRDLSIAPRRMFNRLGDDWDSPIRQALCGFVLNDSWLSDLWLIRSNLSRADLSGSHLVLANLSLADLSYANLRNATLTQASCTRANLLGADLTGSALSEADFSLSNLTNANLTNSDLTSANLVGASLYDTILIEADLTEANLLDANLIRTNLTEADLTEAKLTDADLNNSNLTEANLQGADFTNADLTAANLTGADLTESSLIEAVLSDARLFGANLYKARLADSDLTDADLTGADLTGADLTGATLTRTNLTEADLTRAILREVNLTMTENLTQEQINRAYGSKSKTELPLGLIHPDYWDE